MRAIPSSTGHHAGLKATSAPGASGVFRAGAERGRLGVNVEAEAAEGTKVLAAAEVAAFTLATSEATHTLTGRVEPATVEVSEGTAIPVVHVLEPSSLIHEEPPTLTVEPGWYEVASVA